MNKLSVVILAGGRGSRLGSLTSKKPKPLLAVAGRPFICHVIDYLLKESIEIDRLVLATGYLADQFGGVVDQYSCRINIISSVETYALGTGGATIKAVTQADPGIIVLLNGDTFCPINIGSIVNACDDFDGVIVVAPMDDKSRYGGVSINADDRIIAFESSFSGTSHPFKNLGIYAFRSEIISNYTLRNDPVSLERDLIPEIINDWKIKAALTNETFIDIGIKSDLRRANSVIESYLKSRKVVRGFN